VETSINLMVKIDMTGLRRTLILEKLLECDERSHEGVMNRKQNLFSSKWQERSLKSEKLIAARRHRADDGLDCRVHLAEGECLKAREIIPQPKAVATWRHSRDGSQRASPSSKC
jgi:hypothetical protein